MHISWALLRVAKALLEQPRYDVYDLARDASVDPPTVNNLVIRMVVNGWLSTEDGWIFELTPTGRRELVTVLTRARAFNNTKRSASSS